MEDLNDKLDALLSDPNIGEKLSHAMASLGLSGTGTAAEASSQPDRDTGGDPLEGLGLGVDLGRLMGMMSADGDGQRFLRALAPFLRPSRRKRVEEAQRIMTVCRLLPVLTGDKKEKTDGTTDRRE